MPVEPVSVGTGTGLRAGSGIGVGVSDSLIGIETEVGLFPLLQLTRIKTHRAMPVICRNTFQRFIGPTHFFSLK